MSVIFLLHSIFVSKQTSQKCLALWNPEKAVQSVEYCNPCIG